MPIYEYECYKCKRRFECLVRSGEEDIHCPFCRSRQIKKLISTFAFSSKDAQGNITASPGGCSGCTGGDCSHCAR